MNKYVIVISLIFQLMQSCTQPVQHKADNNREFHLPVIVQDLPKDTIGYPDADGISFSYFDFIGKFKFTDTLLLKKGYEDYIYAKHLIPESDILHEHSMPGTWDSLATDGFQIIPDYNTSVYHQKNTRAPISVISPYI